jgi:hypothetical protein
MFSYLFSYLPDDLINNPTFINKICILYPYLLHYDYIAFNISSIITQETINKILDNILIMFLCSSI